MTLVIEDDLFLVSGQYDFDAFLRMVSKILRAGDDMEDDLKAVFRMFDEEGKGYVTNS